MPWSKAGRRSVGVVSRATTTLFLAVILLSASLPPGKSLSVYSVAANYSLPLAEKNGQDYVGLLEMLDPLGTVSAKADKSKWALIFNNQEFDFNANKTRVRSRAGDFDLNANFELDGGRGLVPLSSLSNVLPRILGGPVTFHSDSRRLFVGNVATHFTAIVIASNPPRLVMNFTSPVSPAISSDAKQLHVVFVRDPLVAPGSPLLTFGNATIPSASYREENGAAEITVTGAVPLAATVSGDGRIITVNPTAPLPPTPVQQHPISALSSQQINSAHRFFAVIDASHGGSEYGAALGDGLAEKDITLAFARRLRQELDGRGISVLLLRDGDETLSLDQRASTSNAARAAVYIAIHAASQGRGVRVYTSLLPPAGVNRGQLLDWNTAQSNFRITSRVAQNAVVAILQKNQVVARSILAPVRPLNNITTSAIAVEIAPSQGDINQLASPLYQQAVCSAIASGIAAVRDRLEVGR